MIIRSCIGVFSLCEICFCRSTQTQKRKTHTDIDDKANEGQLRTQSAPERDTSGALRTLHFFFFDLLIISPTFTSTPQLWALIDIYIYIYLFTQLPKRINWGEGGHHGDARGRLCVLVLTGVSDASERDEEQKTWRTQGVQSVSRI
eukprot:gene6820-4900_t